MIAANSIIRTNRLNLGSVVIGIKKITLNGPEWAVLPKFIITGLRGPRKGSQTVAQGATVPLEGRDQKVNGG